MKILFMGTPQFAVPSLQALIEAGHELCGVFSQPDKPVGRHQNQFQPTPVKVMALSHGIPVFQPVKLRDGTALAQIQALAPELIVVAAYGRFLPDDILACPKFGCINVHSSLLPKYRGAAPINWAILNGETQTGVTIQQMAHDMDAGDIIAQEATPIGPEEDAGQLYTRLSELGAGLLVKTVADMAAGNVQRIPQDHTKATPAPMLSKDLSPVDWTRSAQEIHNQVRGLIPWPSATTDVITGDTIKLHRSCLPGKAVSAFPGVIVSAGEEGIDIACGDGQVLRVLELQAPGKKRMSAGDYLRGNPISGTKLGGPHLKR